MSTSPDTDTVTVDHLATYLAQLLLRQEGLIRVEPDAEVYVQDEDGDLRAITGIASSPGGPLRILIGDKP